MRSAKRKKAKEDTYNPRRNQVERQGNWEEMDDVQEGSDLDRYIWRYIISDQGFLYCRSWE
jgi:hypothetical protein